MNVKMFRNPSANAAPHRELRPVHAEPRLFPGGELRPPAPALAAVDAPRLAVPDGEAAPRMAAPTIAAPGDRLASPASSASAGAALHVALVGAVAAAIIGGFLGVGFLLLERPAEQTVAASQPGMTQAPAPTSLQPAASSPAAPAAAALPAAPATNHAPPDQAAPIPPSQAGLPPSPVSPIGKSPSATAALSPKTSAPMAAIPATKTVAAISDHGSYRRPAALSDREPGHSLGRGARASSRPFAGRDPRSPSGAFARRRASLAAIPIIGRSIRRPRCRIVGRTARRLPRPTMPRRGRGCATGRSSARAPPPGTCIFARSTTARRRRGKPTPTGCRHHRRIAGRSRSISC